MVFSSLYGLCFFGNLFFQGALYTVTAWYPFFLSLSSISQLHFFNAQLIWLAFKTIMSHAFVVCLSIFWCFFKRYSKLFIYLFIYSFYYYLFNYLFYLFFYFISFHFILSHFILFHFIYDYLFFEAHFIQLVYQVMWLHAFHVRRTVLFPPYSSEIHSRTGIFPELFAIIPWLPAHIRMWDLLFSSPCR